MLRRARLRLARRLLGALEAHLEEGVAVRTASGRLLVWTDAAAALTGWTPHEAERWLAAVDDGAPPPPGVEVCTWRARRFGVRHLVTVIRDRRYALALRDAASRLDDLATTDPLTGLANRARGEERVALSLDLARRDGRSVGVIVVDIDRFRVVNESLGRTVGDLVLRAVAERLRAAVRANDTLARIDSNRFMVVLHQMGDEGAAARTARAICDALSEHLPIGAQEVWLTVSAGVAVHAPDREAATDVVALAERALELCKADGGNGVRTIGGAPAGPVTSERLALTAELHRAVLGEGLMLHFQPQLDIDSGRVVGVEALVRWDHPHRGFLGPDAFLPLSYEDGLIVEIDRWVVAEACRQAVRWQAAGLDVPTVAVNLSARTLVSDEVVSIVAAALADSGLSPSRLEIEVSEHVVASSSEVAERRLRELRQLGVLVAIDDFGTGHSSLAHLKRFPLDCIKLDRGFVEDIADHPNPADVAILRSVITLATDLGLRCVAEGVETPAQRRLLRYLRCHIVQGHLYAPAMAPAELAVLLSEPALSRTG